MLKKLAQSFTATHVTVIAVAAILAPSAVYAVTASNVAITDLVSGKSAAVDTARRLSTYDSVQGARDNPLNLVNISIIADNLTCVRTLYTIPTGKSLIIKSAQWAYFNNTAGSEAYLNINNPSSTQIINFESDAAVNSLSYNFDAGVVVHAGALTAHCFSTKNSFSSFIHVQGYLVPAAAAPMAGSPEAAAQLVSGGGVVRSHL